jgi:hypothetical protein
VYHRPFGDQPQRYEVLRAKAKELAELANRVDQPKDELCIPFIVERSGGRWFVRADGLAKLFPQNFERRNGADYFIPVSGGFSYRKESFGAIGFLKWLRTRITGRDQGAKLNKIEPGAWAVEFFARL